MKPEMISAVAGLSGGAGVFASRYAEKKVGFLSNKLVNIGVGAAIFLAGYFIDADGVADVIEGFGAGYALGAAL